MPDRGGRRRGAGGGRARGDGAGARALDGCTGPAGGFRMLLLVGEAGTGKSRLAASFASDHADTVVVLSARAHRLGATSPFGVWAEALDRELAARSRPEVDRLCADVRADLAGLLRALPQDPGRPGPARPVDGFATLVRALARERPVVFVVDDLPLADASSLTALHGLARRCDDVPVLVVGTARPDELAERLDAVRMLVDLEQDGVARRIEVGPLDVPAVRDLAAGVLGRPAPEPLVEWLSSRARGNPLDTLDLLDGLVEEGADLSRPALRRLPDSLADRVALRLSGLDAAALEVVEMLAVIGRRAELRSVVALSGRSPVELVGVLERLVRARLVTEDDDGPELTVEITHPLVADAVYARMGLARRKWQHREAARVLRTLGRDGEAARHFVRSADPGDDEAVVALRESIHAAEERGAFREALTMLGELVTLLPAGDTRWADVVDALRWDAQWVVDHRADSHAALGVPALRAMDAALSGLDDPARQAPVKLRLASFVGWGDGTLAEAQQVCREAVTLFERAGDRRGALLAEHELAWLRGFSGDIALLASEARRVHDEAGDDEVVRSRAIRTVGLMALFRGRPQEAREAFTRTAAGAGEDPHRQLLGVGGLAMTAVLDGDGAAAGAFLGWLRHGGFAGAADYLAIGSWWSGDLVAPGTPGRRPTAACSGTTSPRCAPRRPGPRCGWRWWRPALRCTPPGRCPRRSPRRTPTSGASRSRCRWPRSSTGSTGTGRPPSSGTRRCCTCSPPRHGPAGCASVRSRSRRPPRSCCRRPARRWRTRSA